MAKELPYFKFEPQLWESGMIQLCSLEGKGMFIEICCMYWTRLGNLPYALALQKLCNGNTSLLEELEKIGIYGMEGDSIVIDFLDEQLNEFQETSKKRANAANKRWSDANALQLESKSNAIREDKKREEEKREEKRTIVFPFDSKEFLNSWDQWKGYKKKEFNFSFKSQVSEQAALKKLAELSGGAEQVSIKIIMQSIENGWKGFFELKNNTQNGGQKGFTNFAAAQLANDADYKRL